MSSKIMLYSGPGANPFCVQALEDQLKDLSDDRFHRIDHFKEFSALGNAKEIKAVVIPGGNANEIYFESDLRKCERVFKNTLDQHRISYYGACAGAILASSSLQYGVQNSDHGFCPLDNPFLGLFPGKVIAPLFPKSSGDKISLTDFNMLNIDQSQEAFDKPIAVAHVLGPAFLNAESVSRTEVLTTYSGLPNLTFGKIENNTYIPSRYIRPSEISESIYHERDSGASMLLTSSHPEFNSKIVRSEGFRQGLGITKDQQEKVATKIEVDDIVRGILMKKNFEKIRIRCK
ncbi:MAG: BPL-N domain-containing protein [Chlamydiota bacterium]